MFVGRATFAAAAWSRCAAAMAATAAPDATGQLVRTATAAPDATGQLVRAATSAERPPLAPATACRACLCRAACRPQRARRLLARPLERCVRLSPLATGVGHDRV